MVKERYYRIITDPTEFGNSLKDLSTAMAKERYCWKMPRPTHMRGISFSQRGDPAEASYMNFQAVSVGRIEKYVIPSGVVLIWSIPSGTIIFIYFLIGLNKKRKYNKRKKIFKNFISFLLTLKFIVI